MSAHENMFDYFVNKAEVYQKLQKDFKSEQDKLRWTNMSTFLSVVIAIYFRESQWAIWIFLYAGASALSGLQLFIDSSNRNFALHVIDWIEAKD